MYGMNTKMNYGLYGNETKILRNGDGLDVITNFLKSIELYHIDGPDVMVINFCLASECVLMHAYPTETHFIYMYSTLLSNLHLIIPFDKFDIDALQELKIAPT